eukprot:3610323-Prymnesium_polylepis.2
MDARHTTLSSVSAFSKPFSASGRPSPAASRDCRASPAAPPPVRGPRRSPRRRACGGPTSSPAATPRRTRTSPRAAPACRTWSARCSSRLHR